MGILKDRYLIILVLLGTFIRLLLSTLPGFKIDVDAWVAWAIRIHEVGFNHFYSDQIFTVFAPGYLYVLSLLGFLRSLFSINDNLFYTVVKIPNIISEITLAILAYDLTKRIHGLKSAYIVAVAIFFNIGFIFNSSVWGQTDSTLALFLFLTIYFLLTRRLILASIFLGLSFLVKPQAISILPVFILFAIKDFHLKTWFKITLPAILTIFILSVPFFPANPVSGLIHFIENSVNEYNGTSLFAYNFWGIFGFWIDDGQKFGPLTLQHWGFSLFLGYWTLMAYFYFKKKLSLLGLATLATLSFYFLPTRVHERYLYSGLLFLILFSVYTKNKLLIIFSIILNLIYFLNVYYVYIYYNHFYLKMPSVLFWKAGYNLLDKGGHFLAVVSTVCFIGISFLAVNQKKAKNV